MVIEAVRLRRMTRRARVDASAAVAHAIVRMSRARAGSAPRAVACLLVGVPAVAVGAVAVQALSATN